METDKRKGHRLMTIELSENYNKKLYSKYWAEIIPPDSKLLENSVYDVSVKGITVLMAKLIKIELINFHEIPSFQLSLITGMDNADSIVLMYNRGINVKDFDGKVQLCFFETQNYYPKGV